MRVNKQAVIQLTLQTFSRNFASVRQTVVIRVRARTHNFAGYPPRERERFRATWSVSMDPTGRVFVKEGLTKLRLECDSPTFLEGCFSGRLLLIVASAKTCFNSHWRCGYSSSRDHQVSVVICT
ncbi:hypothetical protein TNIN_21181 [Trichonephila inaurata madagascariensis]|uniref:Uncharacterized protein n=1 Tax=Trichonephila inaurata madagascariensis TaxID=2747483 RepID=A0A8X6YHW9_9ARAC|nr:hypothetical protein TNIN_21181 [Trichonephila inaurata madagascariensis]